MRLYKSIYPLVYFLFSCTSVHTANHYVDKNANGNNNGTSWSNAWESLSDIEWNQIQPGDIIYISGGTDSTVYNESLTISADGTAANLITIRNGLDAGHNGKVIIQGLSKNPSASHPNGIYVANRSYIKLVGLTSRGWWKGIAGHGTNVLYIDSCTVEDNQWGVGVALSGASSDSVFVWNCHLVCDWTILEQTDILGGTGCTYFECKNNYIYQGNKYSWYGHSDCIQLLQSGKQIYYNNWIESVANYDSSAASGLNGQNNLGSDTTLFYNNVIIIRGWVYCLFMDQGNTGHTWILYNNTIIKEYDDSPSGVLQTVHPLTFAKNNIFYSTNSQYPLIELQNPLFPGPINFDYNFYYHPYYSIISSSYNFSQWQAAGYDLHGADGDPLFTNFHSPKDLDLTLKSGSPCRDAGTASVKAFIESWGLPWTDYAGNPRSETTPSIGAYEYIP
jgi:hypothetical protein